ncbi:pol polyprotein, partial [Aduncisulcus paluster]
LNGLLVNEDGMIVIPDEDEDLQNELTRKLHKHVLGGHLGITGTAAKLKDARLYWNGQRKTIECVVRSCLTCQKNKHLPPPKVMGTIMRQRPFEEVSIDTFGPVVKEDEADVRYLVVIVDNFSRFTELVPTISTTGEEAADALIAAVVSRHGVPECIRSDSGRQYDNGLLKRLCERLKIVQSFTHPHHHESNGIVERKNQDIGKHLRKMYSEGLRKQEWVDAVPLIMSLLNDTPCSTTGMSPRELLYGTDSGKFSLLKRLTKEDSENPSTDDELKTIYKNYLSLLDHRLKQKRSTASRKQELFQSKQKEKYDEDDAFIEGEKVLLKRIERKRKGQSINLGPYVIVERKSKFYYLIRGLNGGAPQK